MLLPERMISTSITCTKTDVENVLEMLSCFGEFHIKTYPQEDNIDVSEYKKDIQQMEEAIKNVDTLIKLCTKKTQKPGVKDKISDLLKDTIGVDLSPETQTPKTVLIAANWHDLAKLTIQKITATINEYNDITNSLDNLHKETSQLNHTKEMLTCMKTINADFTTIKELSRINIIFASISVKDTEELQTKLTRSPVYFKQNTLGKETNFICVATPNTRYADIDRLLKMHHAEIFQAPEDLPDKTDDAIKEVDNKQRINNEKEKEQTNKLNKIIEVNKKYFASWKETAENSLLLLKTKAKIIHFGSDFTIEGYIPKNKFNELSNKINEKFKETINITNTTACEQTHNTQTMPPTKLSNNKFVKPFEELTKLYGLPKYNEIDPTPIMAITFPILFGLMFGDLGHGLLLLIGGLSAGKILKKNQGMRNLCYIMAACGIASCITGILFGEFFGQAFTPLLFRPSDNIFTFLIYCLFVGIAQIIVGLFLEMGNYIVNHRIADAVFTSIPKIAFFIGGIYIIYSYQLDFVAWLSGPILAAIIPFIILIVGKPAYLAIAKPVRHSGEHEEMDNISNRLFEGGDFFTRLLGNTISYSRILALLMAHWALMLAVSAIAGIVGTASIGTIILSTVVIIFGNVFVLALEGLIVFIHTLRLHFYEWFSKFYIGTGTMFAPFKLKNTYTKVSFEAETIATDDTQ